MVSARPSLIGYSEYGSIRVSTVYYVGGKGNVCTVCTVCMSVCYSYGVTVVLHGGGLMTAMRRGSHGDGWLARWWVSGAVWEEGHLPAPDL